MKIAVIYKRGKKIEVPVDSDRAKEALEASYPAPAPKAAKGKKAEEPTKDEEPAKDEE